MWIVFILVCLGNDNKKKKVYTCLVYDCIVDYILSHRKFLHFNILKSPQQKCTHWVSPKLKKNTKVYRVIHNCFIYHHAEGKVIFSHSPRIRLGVPFLTSNIIFYFIGKSFLNYVIILTWRKSTFLAFILVSIILQDADLTPSNHAETGFIQVLRLLITCVWSLS